MYVCCRVLVGVPSWDFPGMGFKHPAVETTVSTKCSSIKNKTTPNQQKCQGFSSSLGTSVDAKPTSVYPRVWNFHQKYPRKTGDLFLQLSYRCWAEGEISPPLGPRKAAMKQLGHAIPLGWGYKGRPDFLRHENHEMVEDWGLEIDEISACSPVSHRRMLRYHGPLRVRREKTKPGAGLEVTGLTKGATKNGPKWSTNIPWSSHPWLSLFNHLKPHQTTIKPGKPGKRSHSFGWLLNPENHGCFVFSMVVVYGCGYNPINNQYYDRLITSLLAIIIDNIPLFHMVVVYGCFLMVMPITYSNNSQYMKGRLIKIWWV